jgi:ABC-2 type transport system permease protein
MLIVCKLVFGFNPTGDVLKAVGAIVPMLIALYGFGFAFAGIVLIMREANTLVDTSAFMVQVFSGTDFPVTILPKWLLPISLLLPLTYGLDATRGFLLKTNTLLPLNVEVILLVFFMFVMLWFGSWIFHRIERRVRTLGTLGQH